MAKMTVGKIPDDLIPGVSENASTPKEQRVSEGAPVGDGPKRDPKTGAYQPASYPVAGGIRTDR